MKYNKIMNRLSESYRTDTGVPSRNPPMVKVLTLRRSERIFLSGERLDFLPLLTFGPLLLLLPPDRDFGRRSQVQTSYSMFLKMKAIVGRKNKGGGGGEMVTYRQDNYPPVTL